MIIIFIESNEFERGDFIHQSSFEIIGPDYQIENAIPIRAILRSVKNIIILLPFSLKCVL
jgi:hypothetical protein